MRIKWRNSIDTMIQHQYIQTSAQLYRFLDEIEEVDWIAYDTEFISEGRYQAELSLVQVSTEIGNYILDPLKINDLTPFWERLCREGTTAIAHACRSELEFCYRAIGRFPSRMFDVQLAAAFVGLEYPLNFKSLTKQTIGIDIDKAETRTDWTRRPLLSAQLAYALNDVIYLKEIADYMTAELERRGRISWFLEETASYCEELRDAFTQEQWTKLLGNKRYTRDELAIVRALWTWRRQKAISRNIPSTRIIRDDLILELAKQKSSDPQRISVVRGIRSSADSLLVNELSSTIKAALSLPDSEKPKLKLNDSYPQYTMATQLLNTLVGQYCRKREIAVNLAVKVHDIRRAIARYEGVLPKDEKCKLYEGWREQLLGRYIEDFLSGRYAIVFSSDLEEQPLHFIELGRES